MINKVKKVLDGYNMLYTEEEVNHGIKLTLINKVHITVYSNGTVLVQGTEPNKSNIETILGIKPNKNCLHGLKPEHCNVIKNGFTKNCNECNRYINNIRN